jgi:hypothetical protein
MAHGSVQAGMHAFVLTEMDPQRQKSVVQFGPLLQPLNILLDSKSIRHNGMLGPLFQVI